jgi:hypothetical protein
VRSAAACRLVLLPISLAGCASQGSIERDVAMSNANDCIVHETLAIAPQPVDLDTATYAVLARCHYLEVFEKSMVAKYPGYGDYVREATQKQYTGIVDSVRRGIALARTKPTQ